MKKKTLAALILLLVCCAALLIGCGGQGAADADAAYDEVLAAERLSIEESNAFQTIRDTLDQNYPDNPHCLVYDPDALAVTFYIQAPDGTEAALKAKHPDVLNTWAELVESQQTLCSTILPVIKVGGRAAEFNIIWVFRLDSGSQYTQKDYALWVRNGDVQYDYVAQLSESAGASTGGASGSTDTITQSSGSGRKTAGYAATNGERNALKMAQMYLDIMAFSYEGLIEQLEYEGYSHSEAVYAADNCGADWNEQAALKAADYLELMPFSRQELIEQLEYEGFTHAQAVHGAERNGY